MKLYISDLDGTLLNSRQELSPRTIDIINNLINKGMSFTIATARSFDSAWRIINPINFNLPVVLFNGVIIYDPVSKQNIVSNFMDKAVACEILQILRENGIPPMVHTTSKLLGNKVYYTGIFNRGEAEYIDDRVGRGDKRFTLVDDPSIGLSQDIISIVVIGEEDNLRPIYDLLKLKYNLQYHFTVDIYTNMYWLELTSEKGSKRHGIEYLKKLLGADELITFGDNLNDLPMFEIADHSYAVENAFDIVKKAAKRVIGSNEDDGVAEFLQSCFYEQAI